MGLAPKGAGWRAIFGLTDLSRKLKTTEEEPVPLLGGPPFDLAHRELPAVLFVDEGAAEVDAELWFDDWLDLSKLGFRVTDEDSVDDAELATRVAGFVLLTELLLDIAFTGGGGKGDDLERLPD